MADDAPIVRAGFVALTDCAPIIVARELGFDRQAGICIEPVKLNSWAAMRDHLAFEKLDCAHMLGGLSLAMHLGLGGLETPMTVPLLLGRGGNAITISTALFDEATSLAATAALPDRTASATLLKAVVEKRKALGLAPLRLAMVHAFSSHNYELRAWLAFGGIDPDSDVELLVIPPSKMVDALRGGAIDGYCVGEPWSQLAVEEGIGRIMVTKADLYAHSPEKVLAFRRPWATDNVRAVAALVEACAMGMGWAAQPENRTELSMMLARPDYLDVDQRVILNGLNCAPRLVPEADREPIAGYLSFDRERCGYPHPEAALWLYAQMRRWGQAGEGEEAAVTALFDPSLLKATATFSDDTEFQLGRTSQTPPFDGVSFDPANVEGYWRSFPIGNTALA